MIRGRATVIVIRHVSGLLGVNVDDAVAVVVTLNLMGMDGHGSAIGRAGVVGMAGHGRPVQHERSHRNEHDARDEAT
jgi:hypothetical protein